MVRVQYSESIVPYYIVKYITYVSIMRQMQQMIHIYIHFLVSKIVSLPLAKLVLSFYVPGELILLFLAQSCLVQRLRQNNCTVEVLKAFCNNSVGFLVVVMLLVMLLHVVFNVAKNGYVRSGAQSYLHSPVDNQEF